MLFTGTKTSQNDLDTLGIRQIPNLFHISLQTDKQCNNTIILEIILCLQFT